MLAGMPADVSNLCLCLQHGGGGLGKNLVWGKPCGCDSQENGGGLGVWSYVIDLTSWTETQFAGGLVLFECEAVQREVPVAFAHVECTDDKAEFWGFWSWQLRKEKNNKQKALCGFEAFLSFEHQQEFFLERQKKLLY